jgi:hypothetical protein
MLDEPTTYIGLPREATGGQAERAKKALGMALG